MKSQRDEDQWVAIQHKTFVNWANEQLSLGNRSVSSLASDLCDGVKLVALVEALQLQKVGRVFAKPSGRIQMIHNVGLALKAITEDNVKLVNIGADDIVGGNMKLILGLLWHLILRYQISANKTKSPPKKLMLLWFQNAVPGLTIKDFTRCWQDGIALHALLEHCKPGTAPHWRTLKSQNRVENCRQAMRLAKEHLGIPGVITPEDFASENLDELSSMTYLSYFIKKNSTGYYSVLNWTCKQLKTTNISNLTTDWNDGYTLCALVHSLGGDVSGFPNLDRTDRVGNCQRALEAAEKLGVTSIMTASELSDPTIDHLSMMAYLSMLQRVTPRKSKGDKLTVDTGTGQAHYVNDKICLFISHNDVDVIEAKTQVLLQRPDSDSQTTSNLDVNWDNKTASCDFIPAQPGSYKVQVYYDEAEVRGSPFDFKVTYNYSKVKVTCHPGTCTIGNEVEIKVTSVFEGRVPHLTAASAQGKVVQVAMEQEAQSNYSAIFKPESIGLWTFTVSLDGHSLTPVTVMTLDPSKAKMSGPDKVVLGQVATCRVSTLGCGTAKFEVTVEDTKGQVVDTDVCTVTEHVHEVKFTSQEHSSFYVVMATVMDTVIQGSPLTVEVLDPGQVSATGDGLNLATVGVEAFFRVSSGELGGNVSATVDVDSYQVPISREKLNKGLHEFCYVPPRPGLYNIHVSWNDLPVKDSPYKTRVTDKSCVTLQDHIAELKDEHDRLALNFETCTALTFDILKAGPGVMTAEMLTPDGKHSMEVEQGKDSATVYVIARHEGLHYIHIYWSQSPLPLNPITAYCPGPPQPLDAGMVILRGRGLTSARSPVPAEFYIDGHKAGPGTPEVILKGLHSDVATTLTPLKYDRYKCTYVCPEPGSFLIYVYWSGELLTGCPYKVSATPKGDPSKVRVHGEGLQGSFIGQELRVYVDMSAARPGDITAVCHTQQSTVPCDVTEDSGEGIFVIRAFPSTTDKHFLTVKYDGEEVPGSPFVIRMSEAPDPTQVRVFGPGVEHGLLDRFESRFIVDTHGAGFGQLAVKVKGPRGGFKVDMKRESDEERIITCRYDPSEPGEYEIHVKWSGVEVPDSPFCVQLVKTEERLNFLWRKQGLDPTGIQWRAEV